MKININNKVIDYIAYFLITISIIFIVIFASNNKLILNFFNDAENKSFDYRQSLLVKHRHLKPNKDIVILAIDDASYEYILEHYGEWPISRKVYADIINFIEKDNPKAIVFDLMFIKSFKNDLASDNLLANTMGKYSNIYTGINFDNESFDLRKPINLPDKMKANVNIESKNINIKKTFNFSNCRPIISQLLNNNTKVGMININRSNDGIIRTAPSFAMYKNEYYPYLSLIVGNNIKNGEYIKNYTINKKSNLISNKLNIPLINTGECVLNWYGPAQQTYKNIPFYKLVKLTKGEQISDKYNFKNKIVFVGTTAQSLFDTKSVPIDKIYPGVEIHATYLNNIIDNSFIRKTTQATDTIIIIGLILLITTIVFLSSSAIFAILSTTLVATAYYMTSYYVMKLYNLWIPEILPLFSILITFAISYLAKYLLKSRDFEYQYKLATTDGLTELYNHRYFQDTLRKQIETSKRYNQPFSLIIIDIDFFKKFNDSYGHQAGDAVLKGVAHILKRNTRATDFVCRYGGEEMSIILPYTDQNEAIANAERICKAVANHVFKLPNNIECNVTISLGVSTFPEDGDTPQRIIEKADKALYWAKEHGRNQVGKNE